jgi:pimeloyl-ACP methyl ester carboxylesterase
VAELLRARGHRVFTPTLTGLGERSHLASMLPVTFSTHIHDIANVLRWEDLHDVVLCGHSYAGMVITAVADAMPERIAALVYLDAIIPEAGKSLLDMNQSHEVVAGVLKATAAAGGQLSPALPGALFGTNAADLERVDRLCTPHPFASFCEPVALTGEWLKVAKKTYVRATGWQGYDRLGFLSFRGIADDASWIKVDVPCGHEIMLDAPAALAQILMDAS